MSEPKPTKKRTRAATNGTNNDISDLRKEVAANSTAIQELLTMPTALEELKALIMQNQIPPVQPPASVVTANEKNHVLPSTVDSVSDMAKLLINNEIEMIEIASDGDETTAEFVSILNQTQEEPSYGPPIKQDIADSFLRITNKKIAKEEIEKWRSLYKPPENCKLLAAPKVNSEIWNILPQRSRQKDLCYQQIQNQVSMAAVCFAQIAEKVIALGSNPTLPARQDLLQLALEGATITCSANQELSNKRKIEIKPVLSKEAATICGTGNQPTELLFGDNFTEQIKTSKTAAALVKPFTPRLPFTSKSRFQPYNNSRGKPFSGNAYRSPQYPLRGAPNRMYQRGSFRKQPYPPYKNAQQDRQS